MTGPTANPQRSRADGEQPSGTAGYGAPASGLPGRTCVVTVTYGARASLVRQVVQGALAEGVGRVLVVDNGSVPESRRGLEDLERSAEHRVVLVTLPENRGSAAGYKVGLERAERDAGCEFLWLLDDDNVPAEGAFARLLHVYEALKADYGPDGFALLSFRRAHQLKLVGGQVSARAFRHSSFFGFHVVDLPYKVAKVLGVDRAAERGDRRDQGLVEVPVAPYGGLFFHRNVLKRVGYPDERFFVYVDDLEFTYRFTALGLPILLVTGSEVRDVDNSWPVSGRVDSVFSRLTRMPSEPLVYYSLRNRAYFDSHCWPRRPWLYRLNRNLFLLLLWGFARRAGDPGRFHLARQAIRDGERGLLGRVDVRRNRGHPSQRLGTEPERSVR